MNDALDFLLEKPSDDPLNYANFRQSAVSRASDLVCVCSILKLVELWMIDQRHVIQLEGYNLHFFQEQSSGSTLTSAIEKVQLLPSSCQSPLTNESHFFQKICYIQRGKC